VDKEYAFQKDPPLAKGIGGILRINAPQKSQKNQSVYEGKT
jgi:hypothetical protein